MRGSSMAFTWSAASRLGATLVAAAVALPLSTAQAAAPSEQVGPPFLRRTGTTTLVSRALDGTRSELGSTNPDISSNGRYVAFMSGSPDLVTGDVNAQPDIFRKDLRTGRTELVSVSSTGEQTTGSGLTVW